ncbi:MAG: hypothetical protein V4490_05345, partial [Pseudomonadota bacterium]
MYLVSYLTSFSLFLLTLSALQGLFFPPDRTPLIGRVVAHWAAFFLQGSMVVTVFVAHPNSLLHGHAMLCLVTWLMLGVLGAIGPWLAVSHLRAPVYALAFIALLSGPPAAIGSLSKIPRFVIGSHVIFAGLASALLLLAGLQAIFLAVQHMLLRRSKPMLGIPPILTLEQLLYG